MILGIAILILFLFIIFKAASQAYLKETVNTSQDSIPDTVIIPRQIPAYQQAFALLSDSEVLTYFEYKQGILTLCFKNGRTFSMRLNDCIFDIGRTGKPPRLKRTVYPSGNDLNPEWRVVENDSILDPKQWDEVFAILCQAGKTIGTM